jgi:glyceraldehyde 3-phosphate dehydrogenase
MFTRVAIHEFGRIDRKILRVASQSSAIKVIAINDLSDKALDHLFRYDSVHGTFPGAVEVSTSMTSVLGGNRVEVLTLYDNE